MKIFQSTENIMTSLAPRRMDLEGSVSEQDRQDWTSYEPQITRADDLAFCHALTGNGAENHMLLIFIFLIETSIMLLS